MLPFEFVAGRDYRSRNGGLATCLLNASDRNPEVAYPIVFHHHGEDEFQSHTVAGDFMTGTASNFDIIMPSDTWGVYHVSDGDTPLKAALERWVAAGGKWELCSSVTKNWGNWDLQRPPLWLDGFLYRAAGCTEDREFPQPAPEPPKLQFRKGAWYQRRDGAVGECMFCSDSGPAGVRFSDSTGQSNCWWYTNSGEFLSEAGHSGPHRFDIIAEADQPPAPQPDWRSKPVTCGDMVDYLIETHATPSRADWWQQRAQQDSRP